MFKHLFTSSYLFGPTLGDFTRSDKAYFLLGALLFVIGLALIIYKRMVKDRLKKKLIVRWRRMFLTIGFFGMFWAWLRYELVPFFSMHIVEWVVYFIGLVWAAFIVRYWLVGYKQERTDLVNDQQKKKYY